MYVFDFGEVRISNTEIEEQAIDAWCKNSDQQPSNALTEVFCHERELFVRLANCNGELVTWRVVPIADQIFFQELDEDETTSVELSRFGVE